MGRGLEEGLMLFGRRRRELWMPWKGFECDKRGVLRYEWDLERGF